ncbi:glycosyltransferase family 4 protein [Thioalkalivibrio paradoxus]|uniref:glycosyltransferase family 4 protein n=1 Tax=Thioalkalivibrio paradoxus TaxID=108010 RepID=UPI001E461C03|nr:glycosyltransferase family 1 protein [Thioalkalivibrio paradoxus]
MSEHTSARLPAGTLRVAFGVTALAHGLAGQGVDGIGAYSRELGARLAGTVAMDLRPFVYGPPAGLLGDSSARDVGRFRHQALGALLTGASFPGLRAMAREGLELIHATDHLVPWVRGTPVVATVMDAIPLAHPEWVSYPLKRISNALWRRSVQWANRVITISEYSRMEIERWFGVPGERIHVIPLGVDSRWFEPPGGEDLERVRQHHRLPDAYFLFVGTLQPRKNLTRLIAAHRRLPEYLRRDVPLVVAGRAGWGCDSVMAELRAERDAGLRWLGYVPDADLPAVFAGAAALLFVSLHEGFGLPLLEAFAAGVPVVASRTTALPEVAEGAALMVDPTDTGEIADAMRQVLDAAGLAARLSESGLARAREFTWDRTARMTLDVYRAVV